jgi:hypothetical protein
MFSHPFRFIASIGIILLAISLGSFHWYRLNAVRVNWTTALFPLENGEAELRFTAQVPVGWHMFSQTVPDINGPLPVNIEFDEVNGLEIIGNPIEKGEVKAIYEPTIDQEVNSLEGRVVYTQRIRAIKDKQIVVRGVINYMLSNGNEMLPPDGYEVAISLD